MKTRRIVLCLLALLTLSFLFASCAPADGPEDLDVSPTAKYVTMNTAYRIVSDNMKVSEDRTVKEFVERLNSVTGKEYERTQYSEDDTYLKAIVVGTLPSFEGYDEIKEKVDLYGSDANGSFAMVMNGNVLMIVSYDPVSLAAACDYFIAAYAKEGEDLMVEEDLNTYVVFGKAKYFSDGVIEPINTDTLAINADLASLTVGGSLIDGFSAEKTAYTVADVPYATRYPKVGALSVFEEATVEIVQASDDNGGKATVTVTSRDADPETGKRVTNVYTVTFALKETAATDASIVYKDGADGIVTFVLDDGDHATADFVKEEMLHKYSALRVSYALITKKLATIQTNADKTEYQKDENGKYIYTKNESEISYWQTHLAANNYCEFLSHSWTHAKWGQNDDGGDQILTDYNGKETGTQAFPKGHITMELAASKQILMDEFGQTGQYFVKPGTGMKEYDFYLDLLTGGTIYEGARTTNKKLNDPDDIKGDFFHIDAYMVAATESPDAWNSFIDQAVSEGKWATFCIHNIVSDYAKDPTGHYILQKNADEMFAHANALSANGKLWIATMTEAANYLRLRNATTVSAETYRDEKVTLKISTTLEGENFEDIALTVKVAVPTGWSGTVNVTGGMTAEVQTDADGACFVYLQVHPTATVAQIVLTQA